MTTFKTAHYKDKDSALAKHDGSTIVVLFPDGYKQDKIEKLSTAIAYAFPGNVKIEYVTDEEKDEDESKSSKAHDKTTPTKNQNDKAAPAESKEEPVATQEETPA